MKKLSLIVCGLFLSSLSFSFANNDLDMAISWMNQNWLTKFSNAKDFMAGKSLRRDEAAKFFVQYAKQMMNKVPDLAKKECNYFSDLDKWRSDLKDVIKDACRLGLFQWSQGKFMPDQPLTNAQAITVLIRMIDGKKDETQGHFAQKYFEKADQLGITEGLSLDSTLAFENLATRGEVGMLLYNASKLNGNTTITTTTNNTSTTSTSQSTSTSKITLNTPFIIDGIEYQILSLKKLDKVGVSNSADDYKYPENWAWLMLEFSFKNISSEYWYHGDFRIQNGEDMYDESTTALVYWHYQMWYEDSSSTSLLEGAKKTTYVGFDVDPDTLAGWYLYVKRRAGGNWKEAVKIPLSNLLP